jgi:radical SAM protein with 4Fe4S-binding SPASM domain
MNELGTEMLILTGGEPLLRRDIYDIASYASSLGIWVVMGTNGVLVNEHVADRMIACGVKGVGISIDSVHPEKHNNFRGGPDAWKYSVRALKICKAKGLEVLVQSTIMEENRHEIADLLEFARDHGAWSLNAYFLVKTGRGTEMNELTPQVTEDCLRQLVNAQAEYQPMLVRSKCAPQFKQLSYEMGKGGLESGGCMAGTEYCRITPEGNVTPCPYMDLVAGNVKSTGFSAVWNESKIFQDLRDVANLKGRCGACEFNELCGGCRCRAFSATGDYLAEDPACQYQPGTMEIQKPVTVRFSDAVLRRLERIPIRFVRDKVRNGLKAYAASHQLDLVTSEDMEKALAGANRKFAGMKPGAPVIEKK